MDTKEKNRSGVGRGQHPNSRANLRPIHPGQVLNPGGRPRQVATRLLREMASAPLEGSEGETRLRRRLSPSGRVVADYATGKTLEGDRPALSNELRDLLTPFTLEEMYKGWLDAGGSSVGDTLTGGKPFRTGFKGAARGLPSAAGIPSATYPKLNLEGIVEH